MQLASKLLQMKSGEPGNCSLAIDGEWWTPSPKVLALYKTYCEHEMSPPAEAIHGLLADGLVSRRNRAGTRPGVADLPHGRRGMRVRYFPSKKNNAAIPCEGQPQSDFALLAEGDTEVERLHGHPIKCGGIGWTYQPDFVARMRDGQLIVIDVVPAGKDASQRRLARALACSQLLRSARIEMRVLSARAIQAAGHIDSLRALYHRASFTSIDELAERLRGFIDNYNAKATLAAVREFVRSEGWPPTSAEALLWAGHLHCDSAKKITPSTMLTGGRHG